MTKHRYSRREFMGLSGAGLAGLVGAPWPTRTVFAADNSVQDPDLVVFNAKVYAVDPLEPRVEAFAVKAGRFVAVGSTADIKSLVGKRTQAFDAGQMTVVPGFIDAHNHAPGAILLYEVLVGNPKKLCSAVTHSPSTKRSAQKRLTGCRCSPPARRFLQLWPSSFPSMHSPKTKR